MTSLATHRASIADTFASLKARKQIAFMPFVPAGYPDLATTRAVLPALQKAGASLIEIGFPFSDPIADGPTVQAAFTAALAKKLKLPQIFETIAACRPEVSIPMLAMVSYSIVFRYGVEKFCTDAKRSGFDGVILPDLPPPEAQAVCGKVRAAGLDTVLLIAPSTSPVRRAEIAALCSGFVYYLSVAGITGERDALPADLAANVRALKAQTSVPVCVGFGISRADHVAQLAQVADGAIVGSAVVKRMHAHASESPGQIAAAVGAYAQELLAKVR